MNRGETFEESRKSIDEMAATAFSAHVLTERRPWLWKVARPDSWTYGFFVALAPGAVMVYGDVGEATFRMNASTEVEALDWCTRCVRDWDYVLSKIQNREAFRRFYPGDAIRWAREYVEQLKGEDLRVAAEDMLDDLKRADDFGNLHEYRFHEIADDHGFYDLPSCENWTPGALWKHKALEAFARLNPVVPAHPWQPIADLLDAKSWTPETLNAIADLVRQQGLTIRDPEGPA